MTLVCVPAGEFLMGATDRNSDEKPPHKVTLNAYWIDQTEVSNRQFQQFVQSAGYQTDAEKKGSSVLYNGSSWEDTPGVNWKQPTGPGSSLSGRLEHPVIHVSWNDAKAYCAWAGRSLPSEAQWEKAARGTDGRTYPWGEQEPNANLANFAMNIKDTTAVGQYPKGASPYGALDMAGNVWEWGADWYGETYYVSSPASNPPGPTSGTDKVLRGGSWVINAYYLRVAYRYNIDPTYRYDSVGFRCAASPGR